MKKFRVGVIGTGFIGSVHVEALNRLTNVDVVAIAERINPELKAELLNVPRGFADFKEMIDNENLDAVHICTPNNQHYGQSVYALEHGVAVMCEKPMTSCIADAIKLLDLAKQTGLPCGINFMFRHIPMVQQMKSMIEHGDLGEIFSIHGSYLQDWLYYDTDFNWRLDPVESGKSRAFADIGSHWIDMAENCTGLRVTEVLADMAIFHKSRKKPQRPIETYAGLELRPDEYDNVPISTEDYAAVLFHFNNGAHGSCVISQMYAGRKNQTILSVGGSKAAAHWDSENSNELWVGKRDGYNQSIVKDPSILYEDTKKVISYPGGHAEGFADSFKHQFKKFYAALEVPSNKTIGYSSFEDGYREMELCEKIVESAEQNRWVSI